MLHVFLCLAINRSIKLDGSASARRPFAVRQLDMEPLAESKFEMMTDVSEAFPKAQLHQVHGQKILRFLHRCIPLGRHYHPVFSLFNSSHGFVTVPFDRFRLVHPASWRKEVTKMLLLGADVIPEFSLLAPVVRKLDRGCLVDVGANIGLYTLLLRSVSGLPIIAYEPQPFLSKLLRWTVALNGLTNIEVRPVACGATKGEVPFTVGINGTIAVGAELTPANDSPAGLGTDGDWDREARITQKDRPVVKVPLTTLDDDLAEGPDVALLKIDCEGFEADILVGAQHLLERKRPWLFVEIHPEQLERYGSSVEDVLELLGPYYELAFWSFEHSGTGSKLHRSFAKCRKPKAHRYQSSAEMLAAANGRRRPSQIYCLARPKPARAAGTA